MDRFDFQAVNAFAVFRFRNVTAESGCWLRDGPFVLEGVLMSLSRCLAAIGTQRERNRAGAEETGSHRR